MQRRFSEIMKDMRGLINEWSAPSILLAVSGGVDSMCMAELFAGLEEPVRFAVAHCNFHLRGEESDGDEAFVRRWASEHGVDVHVCDFDTESYAASKGISIEMAARELRYGWFSQLCREHGYHATAVAHNANDNAETLILNLLRGSGMNGLKGMSPVSVIPSENDDMSPVILIRPLLSFTRKQIEGFAFARRIQYREDRTNALSDYKRNRIRNEVFPQFEKINPSFVQTLNRDMKYFAEAEEVVADWCAAHAQTCRTEGAVQGKEILEISLRPLMEEKHWRYLLYHMLEPYGFHSAVLASVEDLILSDRTFSGKRFESGTHVLLTGRDSLKVLRKEDADASANDNVCVVEGAGTYSFNDRTFSVEILPKTDDIPLRQPEGVLIMDADRLGFPFVLRRWKAGDWFVPLGMRGKKKVSDLFTDLKYCASQKSAAVVIAGSVMDESSENQHIAAVAGVRIDDRCKVTGSTRTLVRIISFLADV